MKSAQFADIAELNPRGDKVAADESVSFVGMAELDATTARAVPLETRPFSEVSKGYTVFRDQDILVAKITPCFENGKVGQAVLDHSVGVGSTEFHVVRPSDCVDPRYLLHFLRHPHIRETGTLRMTGSGGQRRVPERFLSDLQVPLPTLEEQHRIAAVLDHADALRAKRRQVLDHLDSLTQSMFREKYADITAETTVEEIAAAEKGSIRTGPFGSQLLHSEFVEEGISVLGLDNVVGNQFQWAERRFITPGKYRQLTRYTVRPGDVLVSIMGTTGRCVVVPDDIPTAINTKHICAITPNRDLIQPEFLRAAFLWHPASRAHLRRQTKGSIMAGLNMGIIKSMPIPVPPMEAQQEFSGMVRDAHRLTKMTLDMMMHDDELFASLQSRAFRGEL